MLSRRCRPGGNADALLSLDLNDADGNQSKTTRSNVESVSRLPLIYVSNAVNLSGFAAKLRYDADILDFVSAVDVVEGRTNFPEQKVVWRSFFRHCYASQDSSLAELFSVGQRRLHPTVMVSWLALRLRFVKSLRGTGGFRICDAEFNDGARRVEPNISAKLAPPVFEETKKGVISFDFNSAAGDQEVFHKGFIESGSLVDVDVYLNIDKIGSDFIDVSNYSVTVEYDDEQLTLISYAPETSEEFNMLTTGGGMVPPLPAIIGANSITFGSAILGPTEETAPDACVALSVD